MLLRCDFVSFIPFVCSLFSPPVMRCTMPRNNPTRKPHPLRFLYTKKDQDPFSVLSIHTYNARSVCIWQGAKSYPLRKPVGPSCLSLSSHVNLFIPNAFISMIAPLSQCVSSTLSSFTPIPWHTRTPPLLSPAPEKGERSRGTHSFSFVCPFVCSL